MGPSLELLGFPLWLLWVTCLAWLEIPFYSLQKRNQRVDFPLKFTDLSKAKFSYRNPIKYGTDSINSKSLFLVCDMIIINLKSPFLVGDMITTHCQGTTNLNDITQVPRMKPMQWLIFAFFACEN